MEEMLRISRLHLSAEVVGSLSGQGDLLQQVSDHIWMFSELLQSYVCTSAVRREYATVVQNSSKMAEQAAVLEEERAGRRVAEANCDVLVEAIKKIEAELAEVKEKMASTKAKLMGSVEQEMECDKLKAELVTMTNKWMEKSQFCVQHEKQMETLDNMINDLQEEVVPLQTDKELLEKEKKELQRKVEGLEVNVASVRKQKLEAELQLNNKLKEKEEAIAKIEGRLKEMSRYVL
ncbi:uncharacterized protein LOC133824135 [Humulus lupulus]|uniref:uncharacterized protein LOC133824135 n=1 Tax=Humulus lupulus TaxID=3486 RepID=UPI002B405CC7|nr:uncharacterized protein LOC133824135 [Humulus lupulus]